MSKVLQDFGAQFCKEEVPHLKPGYLVKVHTKIKEGNKERVQVFQGTVIKTNAGYGVDDTFTVRKISEGVGVERIFPIHSPNITKIEVLRAHKVRRAKLNYLRALSGKALRLKEIPLTLTFKKFEKPLAAVAVAEEAVVAEAAPDKEADVSAETSVKAEETPKEESSDAKAMDDKAPKADVSAEAPAKEEEAKAE